MPCWTRNALRLQAATSPSQREAFAPEGRRSALSAVETVPGVRLVNDETRLVPEAKPFVWSAERDVVRVTLSGSAPLPQVKGRLLEAAKASLGNVEVADQMGLARGAPLRFDAAALLLLDQIGKLKDGKITLSDDKVSLSGMARELGGREAIAAALKNLPEGFSVAANDVKAPPYIFQAYKDPVASTLTLTGNVPDRNAHAALVAAAERKFFSEKVVDNLKDSVGAPASFAAVVVPALSALSRLSTGTLVVSDREVKLSGDALYDAAAAQIRAGLGKDFPPSWQYKAEIAVKPPSAPVDNIVCQQLFADLLAKARIRFESGKADLVAGLARPARPPDRDGAALSHRQYRDRRPYRCRWRCRTRTRRCPKSARRRWPIIWCAAACRPTASPRPVTAARSRSPATIPTKARRRTGASISW